MNLQNWHNTSFGKGGAKLLDELNLEEKYNP